MLDHFRVAYGTLIKGSTLVADAQCSHAKQQPIKIKNFLCLYAYALFKLTSFFSGL